MKPVLSIVLLLSVLIPLTFGLIITSPSTIAGSYASLRASFSAVLPPSSSAITSQLVLANPCSPITINITGKIVFSTIDAGACLYFTQSQNVIQAGGVGLVLYKTSPTFVVLPMLYTASTSSTAIPCISISGMDATPIRNQLVLGNVVEASIGYAPAASSDKQALLAMWTATGGPTWRFAATGQYNAWTTATDPCSAWYGVACDDVTGRVLALALPLNNLVGSIPSSIAALTSLNQIQLSANAGLVSLPQQMFEFPNLISFEASGDGITSSLSPNMGVMTGLKTLNLASNLMTGTIPDSFTQLVNLQTVGLNGNAFTGSIPSAIGNLNQVSQISFTSNRMSGSIPASIGGMSSLVRFEAAHNSFGGNLPDSFTYLTNLTFVDLSGNAFSGPMPSQLTALTKLTYLNVAQNAFSGTFPNLAAATAMQVLDLSNNQFSGALDGNSFSAVLTALRASHNQFTSIVNFSTKKALLTADVSYNKLQSLSDLKNLPKTTAAQINAGISGLTTIDLSHNQMKNQTILFDMSLESWPSLTSINLAYNEIGGVLAPPTSAATSQYLRTIDISNNFIMGSIPDVYSQLPSIVTFDLRNNSLHHGSGQLIPSFVKASYDTLVDYAAGNAFCPSLSAGTLTLYVDNSYHDYLLCQCKTSYRRKIAAVPLECVECPDHLICDRRANDTSFFYEAGWYPTPSILEPIAMISCPNCKTEDSAEFGCQQGYQGRTCSECIEGFFLRGTRCERCQPSGLILFCIVVVIVVAIVIYFTVLFSRSHTSFAAASTEIVNQTGMGTRARSMPHTISISPSIHVTEDRKTRRDSSSSISSTNSSNAFLPHNEQAPAKVKLVSLYKGKISFEPSMAIITIIINYTQTLSILCRFFSLDFSLKAILGIAEIANVSGTGFGYECVSQTLGGTHARYLLTSLQPLVVTAFCGLLALAGVTFIRFVQRDNYQWWIIVCGRILFFLLDFLFFPVLIACISIFKCESDPVTHISYLSEFPYSRCSSVPTIEKGWFLTINLVGIYGLFITLLVVLKTTSVLAIKVRITTMFGFFFTQYKPEFFYGGIIYLTRRLIFSILNGLLDTGSLHLFLSNMVFICLSIMLVYIFRPFKRPVDNHYEIASYVSLAFCYGILFVGSFTPGTGLAKALFWMLVNGVLYLNFIVIVAVSKMPKWRQVRSVLLCEWAKTKVTTYSGDNVVRIN